MPSIGCRDVILYNKGFPMASVWMKASKEDDLEFKIAHCSEYCSVHFDASYDQRCFKIRRFYCGKHLRCRKCLEKRLSFFKETLAIPENTIAITLNDDDKELDRIKKCYKTYVSAFPRDDGMTTLFIAIRSPIISIDDFKDFNYFPYFDIPERELDYILMTPEGRRVSGLAIKKPIEIKVIMGGTPVAEDISFTIAVETEYVTCKATDYELDKVFKSIKETNVEYPKSMNRKDAQEIIDRIVQVNMYRLSKELKSNGIVPKPKRESFEFRFPAQMFSELKEYNQEVMF
jgi:hypothetical protein